MARHMGPIVPISLFVFSCKILFGLIANVLKEFLSKFEDLALYFTEKMSLTFKPSKKKYISNLNMSIE